MSNIEIKLIDNFIKNKRGTNDWQNDVNLGRCVSVVDQHDNVLAYGEIVKIDTSNRVVELYFRSSVTGHVFMTRINDMNDSPKNFYNKLLEESTDVEVSEVTRQTRSKHNNYDDVVLFKTYNCGVYCVYSEIEDKWYFYIGETYDGFDRVSGHNQHGCGGAFGIYTDVQLKNGGKMQFVIEMKPLDTTDDNVIKEHEDFRKELEKIMIYLVGEWTQTFSNTFRTNTGDIITREQAIQLAIKLDVSKSFTINTEIIEEMFELDDKRYMISENDLYLMNELHKIAFNVDISNEKLWLLDELGVTLNEFREVMKTLRNKPRRRRCFDKSNKLKLLRMNSRKPNRFDGFLGYVYRPSWNKSKPYAKKIDEKWEYLTVKQMEQLVNDYINEPTFKYIEYEYDCFGNVVALFVKLYNDETFEIEYVD